MSSIVVRHTHSKTQAQARRAIERVAAQLAERFGVSYEWDGPTLRFARPGISGTIAVKPKEVEVLADIGFLLSAIKPKITSEVRRYLDAELGD